MERYEESSNIQNSNNRAGKRVISIEEVGNGK